MSEQNHLATAHQLYDSINQGDIEKFLDCLTDEIDWYGLVFKGGIRAERIQGKSKMKDFFETSMGRLKRHWQPQTFLSEGSQVVVTGHGEYEAVETGFTFENDWVHLITFKGDKIDELKIYIDPLTFLSLAQ